MKKTQKHQKIEVKGVNQPLIILIVVGIFLLIIIVAALSQPAGTTIDLDFDQFTSFLALIVTFIIFLIVVIRQKRPIPKGKVITKKGGAKPNEKKF